MFNQLCSSVRVCRNAIAQQNRAASLGAKGTPSPTWGQPIPVQQLLVVALGVALVLTGMSIAAVTLARRPPAPFNPFADFTDIFPGQPISAAEARGSLCKGMQTYYIEPPRYECTFEFSSGMFSRIVVVGTLLYIREVSFSLQDDTFSVGDLTLLLGEPVNHALGQMVGFSSGGKVVLAFTRFEHASPLRPIWKVTFTDERMMCDAAVGSCYLS